MIEEKYLELIHAEIDGELGASQRAELSRHLLGSPEARALRDEIRRVCAVLDSVEPVEAPPGLRVAIVESIAPGHPAHPALGRSDTHLRWWRPPVPLRPVSLRVAAAFVGAAIVAAVAFQAARLGEPGQDLSQLTGTMASGPAAAQSHGTEALAVNLQQLHGSVALREGPSGVVLDFDLRSEGPVEVVAAFDGRAMQFTGLVNSDGQDASITARQGGFTVVSEGDRRFSVFLSRAGTTEAQVQLEFYAAGRLIERNGLGLASRPE